MVRSICLNLVLLATAAAMHTANASAFFGWQVARVAAGDVLMVRAFPDPASRILVGYPSGTPLSLTLHRRARPQHHQRPLGERPGVCGPRSLVPGLGRSLCQLKLAIRLGFGALHSAAVGLQRRLYASSMEAS